MSESAVQTEAMERAQGWSERIGPWEDVEPFDLASIRQDGAPAAHTAYNRFFEIVEDFRDYYEIVDATVEVLLANIEIDVVRIERWDVEDMNEKEWAGMRCGDHIITFHRASSSFGARIAGEKYKCYAIRVITDV